MNMFWSLVGLSVEWFIIFAAWSISGLIFFVDRMRSRVSLPAMMDKQAPATSEQASREESAQREPSEQALRVADALMNDRSVYKNVASMRRGWGHIIDRALSVKTKVLRKRRV